MKNVSLKNKENSVNRMEVIMNKKERAIHEVDRLKIEENVKRGKGSENILEFSIRLNDIITERKLHQKDLAEKMGVSGSTISDYRNGKQEPRLAYLKLLADSLDVSTDYLLGRNESKDMSIDNAKISDRLGLSSDAIKTIEAYQKSKKSKQPFYSELIDAFNELVTSPQLLTILVNIVNYNNSYKKNAMELRDKDIQEWNKNFEVESGSISQTYNTEIYYNQSVALFNIQQDIIEFVKNNAKEKYDGK